MTELKTGTISAGEFAELYDKGVIRPYTNNRGGHTSKASLVKRYANNWRTEASGCALLEKSGTFYTLRDFHNRAEALKLGIKLGKVNPKDELLVRVVPAKEGLTSYRLVNSAKAHSNIEKLKNTDLLYGSQIKRVIDATPSLQAIDIPNGFYTTMAHLINDLVVRARTEFCIRVTRVNEAINSTPAELPGMIMKTSKIKLLSGAISYWSDTMQAMFDNTMPLRNGNYPKYIERLNRSPVVLGFLCFDYMFKRKLPDSKTLGRTIAKNATRIDRMFADLVHGNVSEQLEKTARLYEALK